VDLFVLAFGAGRQIVFDLPRCLARPFEAVGVGQMFSRPAQIEYFVVVLDVHVHDLFLGMGIPNVGVRRLNEENREHVGSIP